MRDEGAMEVGTAAWTKFEAALGCDEGDVVYRCPGEGVVPEAGASVFYRIFYRNFYRTGRNGQLSTGTG